MSKSTIALIDTDAIIHIVASVQFKSGNRGRPASVEGHVRTFINTILKNAKCAKAVLFYQGAGHTNFRCDILPEYKGDRVTSDAVKHWKPTILRALEELGAINLRHIESDDAVSLYADYYGTDKCIIVSSDKDMKQKAGIHYNPFKPALKGLERWATVTHAQAEKFFWEQVLCGDSTDMPNDKCGIQGMGPVKAAEALDSYNVEMPYAKIIQKEYTKKYGAKEGFHRANVTFKMVRLLSKYGSSYINDNAKEEVRHLMLDPDSNAITIVDDVAALFGIPTSENLFKK